MTFFLSDIESRFGEPGGTHPTKNSQKHPQGQFHNLVSELSVFFG